jgi:hypothetical protein
MIYVKTPTMPFRLFNGEIHFQALTEVYHLVHGKSTALGAPLSGAAVNQAYEAEKAALKPLLGSLKTPAIEQYHAARAAAYRALVEEVKVLAKTPNTSGPYHQNLAIIEQLLKTYKIDTNTALNEATATVDNLLEDLAKTPAAAAVTQLGLTNNINRLRQLNEIFEADYRARIDEKAAQGGHDLAAIRAASDDAMKALLEVVIGGAVEQKAASLEFLAKYREIASRYRIYLSQHHRRKLEEDSEDTENPETTPETTPPAPASTLSTPAGEEIKEILIEKIVETPGNPEKA